MSASEWRVSSHSSYKEYEGVGHHTFIDAYWENDENVLHHIADGHNACVRPKTGNN